MNQTAPENNKTHIMLFSVDNKTIGIIANIPLEKLTNQVRTSDSEIEKSKIANAGNIIKRRDGRAEKSIHARTHMRVAVAVSMKKNTISSFINSSLPQDLSSEVVRTRKLRPVHCHTISSRDSIPL